MIKKVLIVLFNFPPSSSIGGRRWAYLANQLDKNNTDVYVVSSDYIYTSYECPWGKTIDNFKDKIYYLPHKQPFHILTTNPDNFQKKIKYRVDLLKAKLLKPDSIYDRSLYFSDDAFEKAIELINKYKIRNVIVSGGPFQLLYKISLLKNMFGENLNLLLDLRDPWTENWNIQTENQKSQRQKQDMALNLANIVFVPNEEMKKELEIVWKQHANKIVILPHGYDSEIFQQKKQKGDFKKWFYAGTIYPLMEEEYLILEKFIYDLNVCVSFYTVTNIEVKYKILENPSVKIYGTLAQKELFEKTLGFGIALFLTPSTYKDYKSTKFYEIIKSGTFMLYIGKKGEVSKFINEYKIGYAVEIDFVKDINEIAKNIQKAFDNFEPKPYLSDNYSFENLTHIVTNRLI